MRYKVPILLVILLVLNVAVALESKHGWDYIQNPIEFDVEKPELIENFDPLVNNVVMNLVDGARYDVAMAIAEENCGLYSKGYSEGAWFEDAETIIPSLSPAVRASIFTATKPRFHGVVGYGVETSTDMPMKVSNIFQLGSEDNLNQVVIADPLAYGEGIDWVYGIEPNWISDEAAHNLFINLVEENSSCFPELLYYCYNDTDVTGHIYGGASSEYREVVENSSIYLEEDYEKMVSENLDNVIFVVFSDHGHLATGGHGGPEPEVMQITFFMYGEGVKEVRYENHVAIQQIGATVSYILGMDLPLYTDLPPLFDAIEAPANRKAAYMIYYADLKIKQATGLAAKMDQTGKISDNLTELNNTLQGARDNYENGNYSEAYVISEQVGTDAHSLFEELDDTMTNKIIQTRSLLIALLVLSTAFLVVVVSRKYKIAKLSAMGLYALAIYYAIFLGLLYVFGINLSISAFNIENPAIAIRVYSPFAVAILFAPIVMYFSLKKINLTHKDLPRITVFQGLYNLVVILSITIGSGIILGQPIFGWGLVIAILMFGSTMAAAIALLPIYYLFFDKVLSKHF